MLGVRSTRDVAWSVARAPSRHWPARFRVVVQRGEPGLNPKVNQLVTLAAATRHDVPVVSDSNVRVEPGYLAEIAWLEDDAVGLVTHAIAGTGEARLGSLMDHLHLAGSIAPGVVGAKRLARRDLVVGKSMAFRRADLRALGGFEAVKDVLAEDWVLGRMVGEVLGKRVAVPRRPIQKRERRADARRLRGALPALGGAAAAGGRTVVYAAQLLLLNPILVAAAVP